MLQVRSAVGYISTVVFVLAISAAAVAFVALVGRWVLEGGI